MDYGLQTSINTDCYFSILTALCNVFVSPRLQCEQLQVEAVYPALHKHA